MQIKLMVRKGENRTTSSATPRVDTVSLATLVSRISLVLSIEIQLPITLLEKFEKQQFKELMFCKELIGRSKKRKKLRVKLATHGAKPQTRLKLRTSFQKKLFCQDMGLALFQKSHYVTC